MQPPTPPPRSGGDPPAAGAPASGSDDRGKGRRSDHAATGIVGLDEVLLGGYTAGRLYVVEGVPGAGKTTLALQFALEGVRRGERALYVTLSESREELLDVAASHGWTLDGIDLRELVPDESDLQPAEHYTVFHPADVELGATMERILADVEAVRPQRVVLDSLSELRLLAGSALRYRRQVLALKQFFAGRGCTVLLLDDLTAVERDLQVQSIAHGVLALEMLHVEYGSERRRLRILKHRARAFRGGLHDYAIRPGGLVVFPRLVASEHRRVQLSERLPSDVPALDQLLGGGLEHGTSTLLVGAAGTGKSSLAAQFVSACADRGGRALVFVFDESPFTLLARTRSLGMSLSRHVESQRVVLKQVDPAEMSPGELVHVVREFVGADGARMVVLDSLNGYLNAMPDERSLVIQLHELLGYLGQQGIVTIATSAHQGLFGSPMQTPVEASYLADSVVLLRYYEDAGEVHQAISVVNKRGGPHERSIREFRLGQGGVHVGEPLSRFRGILTGVPTPTGGAAGG